MAEFPKYICFRVAPKDLEVGIKCVEPEEVAEDLRPVIHGNWIDDENMDECKCSVCGTMYNWFDNAFLHKANFCPYCGADMREVKE